MNNLPIFFFLNWNLNPFILAFLNYLGSDVLFAVRRLLFVINIVDPDHRVFFPEGTKCCLDDTFAHTFLLYCVHLYLFRVLCFFCREQICYV